MSPEHESIADHSFRREALQYFSQLMTFQETREQTAKRREFVEFCFFRSLINSRILEEKRPKICLKSKLKHRSFSVATLVIDKPHEKAMY